MERSKSMPGYRTYQTFDEYFADQAADKQEIISAIKQFIAKTAPDLSKGSKWGQGIWLAGDLPVAFVHVEPDYVQLGFYGGSLLDDPKGLLEGKAKYIRHVKIRSPKDIDETALAPLVKQAVKLNYKK